MSPTLSAGPHAHQRENAGVTAIARQRVPTDCRDGLIFESGRRCTHVDENDVRCITTLCRYNPGPDCFIHTPPEQISKREAREAFEQLMSELPAVAA